VEYACQVFHNGLPQYLYDDLETLQKRPLCVIYPDLLYNEASNALNITILFERRQVLNDRLFKEIVEDSSHKLNKLLPLETVVPRTYERDRLSNCRFAKQVDIKILLFLIMYIIFLLINILNRSYIITF
jgi:hypothetical protein